MNDDKTVEAILRGIKEELEKSGTAPSTAQKPKPTVTHSLCTNCGRLWEFERPQETGKTFHCEVCATDFVIGKWLGEIQEGFFLLHKGKSNCPECGGHGQKFASRANLPIPVFPIYLGLRNYIRQCDRCASTWFG